MGANPVAALGRVRPPHLIRRGDTYHLRVRVPRELLDRVGMSEVRRSLRVGRLSDARLLAPVYAVRVKEGFKMMLAKDLSRDDCIALIQGCFSDLAGEVDRVFLPRSPEPAFELAEQHHHSDEELSDLTRQITSRSPEGHVAARVEQILTDRGVSATGAPEQVQALINIGVLRALAEQQRLFQFRLREPILPYVPTDPLFAGAATVEPQQGSPPPPLRTVESDQPVGPS